MEKHEFVPYEFDPIYCGYALTDGNLPARCMEMKSDPIHIAPAATASEEPHEEPRLTELLKDAHSHNGKLREQAIVKAYEIGIGYRSPEQLAEAKPEPSLRARAAKAAKDVRFEFDSTRGKHYFDIAVEQRTLVLQHEQTIQKLRQALNEVVTDEGLLDLIASIGEKPPFWDKAALLAKGNPND